MWRYEPSDDLSIVRTMPDLLSARLLAYRSLRNWAKEWLLTFRFRVQLWNIEKQNPVIIYQMGKVGSSTVARTLREQHLRSPILHVHTLNRESLQNAIKRQRQSVRPRLPAHLIISKILTKKLEKQPFACRIITLTREPVSRAISFIYEDIFKQAPDAVGPNRTLDTTRLVSRLEDLLTSENGVSDPTRWFESELNAVFGVDVFEERYDVKRGFNIMRRGDVSVLVLRMEDVDRALPDALGSFFDLNAEQISATSANIGEEKWYASSLRDAKRNFTLSPATSAKIKGTRYFRHFYS